MLKYKISSEKGLLWMFALVVKHCLVKIYTCMLGYLILSLFSAALGLCGWVYGCRLSLVAASVTYSSLQCMSVLLQWLLLFGAWIPGTWASVGQHVGSLAVAHRLSCSAACGVFPDQWLNLRPLHWQVDP